MSYDSLLLHRCKVRRSSSVFSNELGHPILTWADHLTGVHCRYYPVQGGENETVQLTDVLSGYLLHVRRIDVHEGDRIESITLGGTLMDAGPFDVELVKHRADSVGGHHLELVLKRVGPTAYLDPTA